MGEDVNSAVEILKIKKEIWAKAVDTQMHFNEMSVKTRQLGLSFVVAALGLAVVLLSRSDDIFISVVWGRTEFNLHVAGPIILIAAVVLMAVRKLDLGVYHQMLRGAVEFGMEFEKKNLRDEVMKTKYGMTEFISLYSRHKIKKTGDEYVPQGETSAEDKINKFYNLGIFSLMGTAVLMMLVFSSVKEIKISDADPTTSEVTAVKTGQKQDTIKDVQQK